MTARLPFVATPTLREPTLADALALLRELIAEVRALRSDLRRSAQFSPAKNSSLVAAIAEEFGPSGRFTAAGLLQAASEEPDGALAAALGAVIDLDASPRSKATALGTLLAHTSGVEVVSRKHGIAIFSLCTSA